MKNNCALRVLLVIISFTRDVDISGHQTCALSRTQISDRSFTAAGPRLWNNLLVELWQRNTSFEQSKRLPETFCLCLRLRHVVTILFIFTGYKYINLVACCALQPLVVMTSVPTLCANAVQALVNMISPLKFSLDFRPFFTIHDSEFKEYTSRTQSPYVLLITPFASALVNSCGYCFTD